MNSVPLKSSAWDRWTQQLWAYCYFKFVLPRIERTTIDGIILDLSALSPKVRNRIINVGFEEAEREICRQLIGPNDTILELGGGIGLVGLFCQLNRGVRRYVTVEANPATIEILKVNYLLNNITPVIWNLALGPKDGMVNLDVNGDFWEHHICSDSKTAGSVSVVSATLPSLLTKADFSVNTLIIDIEGAEAHIDFSSLPSGIKKIIIEIHRENLTEEAAKRLFSNIKEQGFHTTHCKESTFGFVRN